MRRLVGLLRRARDDLNRAVVLDVHDAAADRLVVGKVDEDVIAWSPTGLGLIHVDQDASSTEALRVDPQQIDMEMRRALAEFHQLISSATPDDLRRPTNGTRWTNQQLLFHMVLGYGIVRTLLPLVRTLGRLGHSRGFATTLNAGRRPFHWINYVGPCVAARLLNPRVSAAALDRIIGSLRHSLAAETDHNLTLSMHMPTSWDPYFTPTMSVLDVYHFGTQHFDHHRRQLTLPEPPAQP